MASPLESLVASGTKLWLDSVDPDLIEENLRHGASGATSNPIIIADLIKTGRYDDQLADLIRQEGLDDETIAWRLTDQIVHDAQQQFLPTWQKTGGNDGWVSFELDPLVEDPDVDMAHSERVAAYLDLGQQWSKGHQNRMIKIPATPAGLDAIEDLAAAGVTLNVTLIFTDRQYQAARDAMWRGAQRRGSLDHFKSVYSIFVSRIDVYTEKHASQLSDAAQGQVGTVNAKRLWQANQEFWAEHATPLDQEIIFASTGVKKPEDKPWKYVAALAGSDIQTNPPATNEAIAQSDQTFEAQVAQMPPEEVLAEIDRQVDFEHLEQTLMAEGVQKFADPQKALLKLISERRNQLATV